MIRLKLRASEEVVMDTAFDEGMSISKSLISGGLTH
jgi:hypothetical protein